MYSPSILLMLPIIVGVISGIRGNQDDLTAKCDGTKSDGDSSTKQNLACANEETKLYKDLFGSYGAAERATRGVKHHGDKMKASFGLKFINVADMDTTNGVATITAWYAQTWTDDRLQWKPSDYGGLKNLRVPPQAMWKPDIALYNGLNGDMGMKADENILVYSNGQILWIPIVTVKAACKKTGADGDSWTCGLKYGSWAYDANQIDLDFYEEKKEIDVEFLTEMQNGYTVTSQECEKITKHYPGIEEPYVSLQFNFKLSKK